jgi:hypothetical protein
MLKDYQFAAVELLSQMVRKEAFEILHFRKFFNTGAKLPKKHVRLLSKRNKLAAV